MVVVGRAGEGLTAEVSVADRHGMAEVVVVVGVVVLVIVMGAVVEVVGVEGVVGRAGEERVGAGQHAPVRDRVERASREIRVKEHAQNALRASDRRSALFRWGVKRSWWKIERT